MRKWNHTVLDIRSIYNTTIIWSFSIIIQFLLHLFPLNLGLYYFLFNVFPTFFPPVSWEFKTLTVIFYYFVMLWLVIWLVLRNLLWKAASCQFNIQPPKELLFLFPFFSQLCITVFLNVQNLAKLVVFLLAVLTVYIHFLFRICIQKKQTKKTRILKVWQKFICSLNIMCCRFAITTRRKRHLLCRDLKFFLSGNNIP